jgi:hypothetical protein
MAERKRRKVCHEFSARQAKFFSGRMEKPGVRQTNPLSSNSAAKPTSTRENKGEHHEHDITR